MEDQQANESITASGVLLIPRVKQIKSDIMVIYFHGATFDKQNVPSRMRGQIENAGLFAANGYITILSERHRS